MQHGSQLLNRSLKGQIRINSSTTASKKQMLHLLEAKKARILKANSTVKDLPDIANTKIDINQQSRQRNLSRTIDNSNEQTFRANNLSKQQQQPYQNKENARSSIVVSSPDLSSDRPAQPRNFDAVDFDPEKITPEFAAKIVKYFVLPMFENAPRQKLGSRLGGQAKSMANSGMVYSELKLSDQLNDNLGEIRTEVMNLKDTLEAE